MLVSTVWVVATLLPKVETAGTGNLIHSGNYAAHPCSAVIKETCDIGTGRFRCVGFTAQ